MTTLLDIAKLGGSGQGGLFSSTGPVASVRYGTVTSGGTDTVSVLLDGATTTEDSYTLDGDEPVASAVNTGNGTIEAEVEAPVTAGTRVAVALQGSVYKVISIGDLAESINNYVWVDASGLHITPTEGRVVGGEGNVLVDSSSIGIYLGEDRLIRASSDGANSEVYFGASTEAAPIFVTLVGEFCIKRESAPSSQAIYSVSYTWDNNNLYARVDDVLQIVGTRRGTDAIYDVSGNLLYTVGDYIDGGDYRYVYDSTGALMEGYICCWDIWLDPQEEIANSGAKLYVTPTDTQFIPDAAPYYINADSTGVKLIDKDDGTEAATVTPSGISWSNMPEGFRIRMGKDSSDPSWSCVEANGILNLVTTDLRVNGEPLSAGSIYTADEDKDAEVDGKPNPERNIIVDSSAWTIQAELLTAAQTASLLS